jgi:hypothetical protein
MLKLGQHKLLLILSFHIHEIQEQKKFTLTEL